MQLAYEERHPSTPKGYAEAGKPARFSDFWKNYKVKQLLLEQKWGRSLFGAHLDDFSIHFDGKKARIFASRGQQKLIVFLIKLAQLYQLYHHHETSTLLLDDFLTDFDQKHFHECIDALLALPKDTQTFITTPLKEFLAMGGDKLIQAQDIYV